MAANGIFDKILTRAMELGRIIDNQKRCNDLILKDFLENKRW